MEAKEFIKAFDDAAGSSFNVPAAEYRALIGQLLALYLKPEYIKSSRAVDAFYQLQFYSKTDIEMAPQLVDMYSALAALCFTSIRGHVLNICAAQHLAEITLQHWRCNTSTNPSNLTAFKKWVRKNSYSYAGVSGHITDCLFYQSKDVPTGPAFTALHVDVVGELILRGLNPNDPQHVRRIVRDVLV